MYDWPAVDELALQRVRSARASTLMDSLRLDHLLLTSFDNIRYVTGYRTLIIAEAFDWFAAVASRDGDFEMFVPWVDEAQKEPDPDLPGLRAVHPLPSWTPAIPHVSYWVEALRGVLAERRARRVGYEMLYAELLGPLIEALPEVEFLPVTTALHDLRMRKDALELALLEAASKVNSIAANAALKSAEAGMTDYDVLSVAMASMQAAGVEFLSHSLCNVRRGSGTWFAVGNEFREGDPFFFDIGCYGPGGYASDMARTGFIGEPPQRSRRSTVSSSPRTAWARSSRGLASGRRACMRRSTRACASKACRSPPIRWVTVWACGPVSCRPFTGLTGWDETRSSRKAWSSRSSRRPASR